MLLFLNSSEHFKILDSSKVFEPKCYLKNKSQNKKSQILKFHRVLLAKAKSAANECHILAGQGTLKGTA